MSANRPHRLYSYPFKPMALTSETIDAMLAELAAARVETDTGPRTSVMRAAAFGAPGHGDDHGDDKAGTVCICFADASGEDIEMVRIPHHAEAAARRWVMAFNKEVAQRALTLAA